MPPTFNAPPNAFNPVFANPLALSSSALGTGPSTFAAPSNPFLTAPPPLSNLVSSFWGFPLAQSPPAAGWMPPTFSAPPNAFNPVLTNQLPPPPPLPTGGIFGNLPASGYTTAPDGSGITPDLAQGIVAAPSALQTSLLQPFGSQLNLSSPSQPGAPANGKVRSDQMINGLNGALVPVAPLPNDRVTQALSDSWDSLKATWNAPLLGPFTVGDLFAAGLLSIPGVGEVAEGAEATKLAATISRNYRAAFFAAYPELKGQVVIHHAVEQWILRKYPDLFSEAELQALENLRGIPNELNSNLHLSVIRLEWNAFYKLNPNATREQIVQKAVEIDAKYGSQFNPPIK
jgi:hypothetical protein